MTKVTARKTRPARPRPLDPSELVAEPGFVAARDVSAETITGTVTRLFFESDSFTAGVMSSNDAAAKDPLHKDCRFAVKDRVALGERITLRGAWEETRYGMQFVADHISYPAPDMSVEGLAHYLATDSEFHGLGPVKARLIAEAFGEDFDRAIREEPERVAAAAKLTAEQIALLRDVWTERQDVNAISTWLSSYGLTASQIRKIAKQYGNHARSILQSNPYALHEHIQGIGFQRNDEIALKMGVEPMESTRLRAAILYYVNQAHNDTGHTYIPKAELIAATIKGLYLDDLNAEQILSEQIEILSEADPDDSHSRKPRLITVDVDGAEYVGAAWLHTAELYIYEVLRGAKVAALDYSNVDPVEVGLSSLTDEQQAAVHSALTEPVTIITGGAGTGKSHTIRCAANILRATADPELNANPVEIATPTGKAARRLQADGVLARTIHRLLEWSPITADFTRNETNKLDCGAVIIDEVSMCSVPLLYSLCRAIDFRRTRLILVGDANQLPPIGPGNTLRDFIAHKLVPTHALTKCHRNAGRLKENCAGVLRGSFCTQPAVIDKESNPADALLQALDTATPAWSVIADCEDPQRVVQLCCILQATQFEAWGFDPLIHCQIITPQNPGPLGVNRLNLELQRVQQAKYGVNLPVVTDPSARPAILVGDKVMNTKNDYDHDLMNGTQGVIRAIEWAPDPKEQALGIKDKKREWLVIQFDDRSELLSLRRDDNNLVLAYAVTVHKVQGSQYPCVVSIAHKTHTYMLSRNLLYTAVSRARFTSITLGNLIGIRRAVRTITNMDRRTWTALYARHQQEAGTWAAAAAMGTSKAS